MPELDAKIPQVLFPTVVPAWLPLFRQGALEPSAAAIGAGDA